MGRALVTNVAVVSDPGATVTATAAGAGSSLTVSNFASTDSANLVHLSRTGATGGIIRLRSPKLVYNVQGIRYAVAGATNYNLLSLEALQALYAQDTLTLEVTGGATEVDGGVFTVEYNNLPGGSPTLKMPGDISGITKFVEGIEVNAAASATPGAWADTLVNNLYDVFIGNTDYAVLGYVCDTPVGDGSSVRHRHQLAPHRRPWPDSPVRYPELLCRPVAQAGPAVHPCVQQCQQRQYARVGS